VPEEACMASEIIGADTARWRELDTRDPVHPLGDF
jgi:hypothetical protein